MRYAHAAGYGVVVADDTVTDGTAESAAAAAVDAAADRATGAPRGVPRGPVPTQAAPGLPRFSPIFNFRDVGGHRGLDGRTVKRRRLYRSDDLSHLHEADMPWFRQTGVRTVLDLRRATEIARVGRVPVSDGVSYLNLDPGHREWTETPFEPGMDPRRYLADRYHDLLEQGAPRLAEAIALIADEATAPVVVHCVAGKDRTGVLCALTLALLGVADEDIDADYARSEEGNRRWVEWMRANGRDVTVQGWWRSPRGTMALFLSELRKRHGSVEAPLYDAGLKPRDVTALRAHLLG